RGCKRRWPPQWTWRPPGRRRQGLLAWVSGEPAVWGTHRKETGDSGSVLAWAPRTGDRPSVCSRESIAATLPPRRIRTLLCQAARKLAGEWEGPREEPSLLKAQ